MSYSKYTEPKVSIVVPVYNAEKYICRCIDSILNQTYKNFEVILIDDGSTDNSLEILKGYALKDIRLKVLSQKNSGPSSARNTGILIAKGEYLIFIDIDDYIDKDYLAKSLEKMKPKTIVFTDTFEVFQSRIDKRKTFPCDNTEFEKIKVLEEIINGSGGLVCCKMIDLNLIKKEKILFDINFNMCEDQLFFLEVALKSSNFYYINEFLYFYDRKNEFSLSLKYKDNLYENQMKIFEKIENILEEDDFKKKLLNSLERKKSSILEMAILNEFNGILSKEFKKRFKSLIKLQNFGLSFKLFFRVKIVSELKKIIREKL
ncbi:glycosyltransferase family 2 protein [Cetobacterium sp.]|uniref:glycosyltransferase family 2 protein n=1 Tax=Cetobacterium sp. TaxID=2071632 RepID=UPI003F3F7561